MDLVDRSYVSAAGLQSISNNARAHQMVVGGTLSIAVFALVIDNLKGCLNNSTWRFRNLFGPYLSVTSHKAEESGKDRLAGLLLQILSHGICALSHATSDLRVTFFQFPQHGDCDPELERCVLRHDCCG